jgi:hypothetical protein
VPRISSEAEREQVGRRPGGEREKIHNFFATGNKVHSIWME